MEIIHIVLGKANPDRMNGVNKVVYQLATEQVKAGKNIQVWGITPNPLHDYPNRLFITQLFKASKFPFGVNESLKRAIITHKNAVFHLHGGWVPVFSSLSKIFRINNIKYVLTPHGAYNEVAMQKSKWIKKLYFQFFEQWVLLSVQKVHSIGKSEVNGLARISPNTKSFLLPYGFEGHSKGSRSKKHEEFIVGFVGRLDTHTKGLDLILTSIYTLYKSIPYVKLWIIGDGKDRSYIEKYIKEKKLNNVVLWGKRFGREKDELISKMHVFAHPSRNEGLPTSVLEAAALGVPAIVTQATNLAEYVSDFHAGISIEDNNVDQLTDAIQVIHKAYLNNHIEKYLEGTQKMLKEIFSWSKLVEQYDELYN